MKSVKVDISNAQWQQFKLYCIKNNIYIGEFLKQHILNAIQTCEKN